MKFRLFMGLLFVIEIVTIFMPSTVYGKSLRKRESFPLAEDQLSVDFEAENPVVNQNEFLVDSQVLDTYDDGNEEIHVEEAVEVQVPAIALVLMGHDRPEYFRQCLSSLAKVRRLDKVSVILSMDASAHFAELRAVVAEFDIPVAVWETLIPEDGFYHTPRDHITTHHAQVFSRVFQNFDYAIILETDLTVSPDFVEYMLEGSKLLPTADSTENRETVYCISGWNDNGFKSFSLREDRLLRTDFFPGLGWMIHASTWHNILAKEWPGSRGDSGYDWWVRTRTSVKLRDCIVPEVSRTHHIAKFGTHVNGDAYKVYDAMLLASGQVAIPPSEFALVGSMQAFEDRIKSEKLHGATLSDNFLSTSKSIVLYNSKNIESINKKFGLYGGEARSGHKGLYSFTMKDSNRIVTIVNDQMLTYWGIS